MAVYRTMLTQIALEYHVLPDLNAMPMHRIRFWYDGIRRGLQEAARTRAHNRQQNKKRK